MRVMGIVNVTPDSFSDGGRFIDPSEAIAHGRALRAAGADILDIGGESTRPGAQPIPTSVEIARVLSVVEVLALEGPVSIDTRKEAVARVAVGAGATLINDISATLAPVAGELGVGWVAMHSRGDPTTMQIQPTYDDVVAEVAAFLEAQVEVAKLHGVRELYLDPGIGFGKTIAHNLALLRALPFLASLGAPVLVGTSRKRFLSSLSNQAAEDPPPLDREEHSLASAAWSLLNGASMVRVHEVESIDAFRRLVLACGTTRLGVS
ncbi:MAG: dihydropteroate synthase [Ferrimicrobium sp.]